jgi:hypothetical protein
MVPMIAHHKHYDENHGCDTDECSDGDNVEED